MKDLQNVFTFLTLFRSYLRSVIKESSTHPSLSVRKEVTMTQNQINYWKLQEEERSNRAKEKETKRSNMENESILLMGKEEEQRHNQASEAIQNLDLVERARHNTVTEGEALRSNLENENIKRAQNSINYAIGFGNIEASRYATAANVGEATRHNMATEGFNYCQIGVNTGLRESELGQERARIKLEQYKAGLTEQKQAEEARHNAATELENRITNRNREKLDSQRILIDGISVLTKNIPLNSLVPAVLP